MLIDNFLGGISWALGVWIGTTLIVAIIFYILSKINYVPIIGTFVSDIIKFVAANNPRL